LAKFDKAALPSPSS